MLMAQNRTVTGTVSSAEDGEPVIGASVIVPGTNIGTVTDIDGQFSLKVPENAKTLRVSYVGMAPQDVKISNKMNIVLDSDNEILDEVMVVAFGQQKKSSFTGSAAVVKSEDLGKRVTTNVTNALVGSVPGLQIRGGSSAPGAGEGSIYIRGVGSMYAEANPLVIVDGAPYPASLSNIPQSDIESVTVLKDAASAALYGARGAAGVILVTTKRGNSSDARITLDMKWGQQSRAVQEYDKITDPGEFYEAYYAQTYNYVTNVKGLSGADANVAANKLMMDNLQYQVFTIPQGQQLVGMDGKLNPSATPGYVYEYQGQKYWMQADDWLDASYRKAMRQEYTLSATGGNDKMNYYSSLGFLDESGILHFSGYKRINGRIKADYQAKKWLRLGVNAAYTNSETKSTPNLSTTSYNETNPAYFATYMAPIFPIYVRGIDENGKPYIMKDSYGLDIYDLNRSAANSYPGIKRPFLTGNPIGANHYNKRSAFGNQLNTTVFADVTFTDWLKLSINSNVVWGETENLTYQNMFSGPSESTRGAVSKNVTTSIRTNNSQTLNFNKTFGKHNVTVLAGHEYYKTTSRYLGSSSQGVFSEDILEIDATAKANLDASSYTTNYNVEGFFGSAQYNFDDKYYLSGSYRRDASSRFSKENHWGDFWSVGGAYIISKEKFMESTQTWLDQLKLKASIGQQGNDGIGNFRYTDLYQLVNSGTYTMSPSFYAKGNDAITWETTTNLNIGAEFSLFKGRFTGSFDWYRKKITDLLFSLSVPVSSGYTSYYSNVGDISNTGFELVLSGSVYRTKDIDINITANASHNYAKIDKLPEAEVKANGGFVSSNRWFTPGGPYYNPFRYSYAGVNEKGEATYWVDSKVGHDAAKPGTSKDKVTTNTQEATYYEMGNIAPALNGGFALNFRYKFVDLSLTFDYQIGGKLYDSQYASLMSPDADGSNGYTIHKDYAKSWSYNNTESNIPRWQYNDLYTASASDRFYVNASYLNFQSVNFGLTMPKKWLANLPMSSVRFYAAGENLIFWSARKGLDPRASFTSGNSLNAYNQATRNLSAGVQVTF